ncbi:MAG TPA: hypothetical protein VMB71_05245 [Acetobacteraceae bacterium]|nr:hypothetical protein [Acetobacteraceae bacterium]
MKFVSARFALAWVARGIGLAGSVGLVLAAPAFWLRAEGNAAQEQAAARADAAAQRAQIQLATLFSGFERATGSLRADQVAGDKLALTSRLLLLEPLAVPVTGLTILDKTGAQIAASAPDDAADKPWWGSQASALSGTRAMLLGCDKTLALAHGITNDAGETVAFVGGALDPAALRAASASGGDLAVTLRADSGCALLHTAATAAAPGGGWLASTYRKFLPPAWGQPEPTEVSVHVGNLAWTASVTPAAALGARAAIMDRRGHAMTVLLSSLLAFLACREIGALLARRPTRDTDNDALPPDATRTALVVGFDLGERLRIAGHLTAAGLGVEQAPDGYLALGMAERAACLRGTLELVILDAAMEGLSAEGLIGRLKGRVDLDRLHIVLATEGRIAGVFGAASPELDTVVANLYGMPPEPPPSLGLRYVLAPQLASHAD